MTDETDPDKLIETLKKMRGTFGDEPFLLAQVEKTIDALRVPAGVEDAEEPDDDAP